MSVVVIARFKPAEGAHEAVKAALTATVAAVEREDGCERYAVHESGSDLVLIEQWRDRDALKTHSKGEAFASLQAATSGKLLKPFDVEILTPCSGESARTGTPEG
jgi:quinol monooxygenase YgiN